MVHLVIKAANGAVDDFRVSGATPEWTVAQVKNYLYRHYPTHPVSVGLSGTWSLYTILRVVLDPFCCTWACYIGLSWPNICPVATCNLMHISAHSCVACTKSEANLQWPTATRLATPHRHNDVTACKFNDHVRIGTPFSAHVFVPLLLPGKHRSDGGTFSGL